MFIRNTKKIDKKTGKNYFSYQLVEAYRTDLGPRQKILLTIGSDLSLNVLETKELASRIREITQGIQRIIPFSERIESLAQHFAQLLFQKEINSNKNEKKESNQTDFHSVDINNIQHTDIRTIGPEYVALHAYEELNFDKIFTHLKFSDKQKTIAAAAIIGRAVYPSSERALHNKLQYRSGLDELLKTSFARTSLDQFYRISDAIYNQKKAIESHLREREKILFDLKETIILYDITNTFFEGKAKKHTKAKRGKSKEMRFDCPLVSLGVVLDSQGFPKHSEVFDGNINERATLEEMINRLNKQKMAQTPIIVLDSGIATKDNINWLKSQGYEYIVMMKKKERPPVDMCKEAIIRNEGDQFISATLKYDDESGDHFLWCYSQKRLLKEQDIKEHKSNALEDQLAHLKEGLGLPGRMKTVEKIHQKIGRLREKYSRLAQHYEINVQADEDGKIVKDISWKCNEKNVERSFSGTYTLRTNVKNLSEKAIWDIYVMLSEAESCFRCLKSEAGLRPNWHSREDRIDGHLFLSLLAYHLVISIRTRLKDCGIHESWQKIKEGLSNHSIISTTYKTKEGATIYLKQVSEPNAYQRSIYEAFGIPLKPLKTEKIIIQSKDVVSKV
jgi:transposase